MNELEFLRSQLRLEHTHYTRLRALLGRSLPGAATDKCLLAVTVSTANYVVFVLQRAARRDHIHADQIEARLSPAQALRADERNAIIAAVAQLRVDARALGAAVEALAAALPAPSEHASGGSVLPACHAFDAWASNFNFAARAALEPWLERLYDIGDWRRAALTDAEAVFQERRLRTAATDAARAAALPG